ncbi:hypothetical protein LINPERPRIM_LOCUS14790 [Linum perenne]
MKIESKFQPIFSLYFRLPAASSHFSHLSLLYSIFFSFNLQKNYEQKSKPRCLPFQAVAVVVDQVPLCFSLAGAASVDCFFSSRRRGSKPSRRHSAVYCRHSKSIACSAIAAEVEGSSADAPCLHPPPSSEAGSASVSHAAAKPPPDRRCRDYLEDRIRTR